MERSRTGSDGPVIGLIGFATVICSVSVVDVIRGRTPFRTPEVLGRALLGGASVDPAWCVLAYTGLHLVVFLAIGHALVALARRTAHRRGWRWTSWLGVAIAFFALEASLMILDPERLAVSWGSTLFATAGAAIAMGAVLARRLPERPTTSSGR